MPRTLKVAVIADDPSQYQLSQLKASGKFEPAKPARPGFCTITIPAMDGGYSEFLFVKYNRHIPEEYPVIQVMKAGKVVKELSIRDIEKLQVQDGCYQLIAE